MVIHRDLEYPTYSLIQEMRDDLKGIKLQIKEQMNNTINAVEKTVDPNATGRRMATRFCGYCRTYGHTPNWCRKKMRDEEVKKVQNETNTERKIVHQRLQQKNRTWTWLEISAKITRFRDPKTYGCGTPTGARRSFASNPHLEPI